MGELILGSVLVAISVILTFYVKWRIKYPEQRANFVWGVTAGLLLLFGYIFIEDYCRGPRAIDVYRGKTTIKTTQTAHGTDSTVIYKDDYEGAK